MKRTATAALLSALALGFVVGCNKPAASDKAGSPAASADEPAEVTAALAKLPPADEKAARAQRICPVTGELLGSMDTPYAVEVNGQRVFLCCAGCEEDLKKEPEKYLAKLKK